MSETQTNQQHVLSAKSSGAVFGGPSFTLRHRVFRAVWSVTWLLLASWTPPPLHPWRRFLLRLFGAKIASTARIYGSVSIWYPPNLEMGAYSVLGWRTLCYNMNLVRLEDFANVAQHCFLLGGSHDIDDPSFQLITKPIVIGRYAWVAGCATVGPGVTMKEGSVLGGAAVTFRDLEPWTVYVGNPAKPIRKRKVAPPEH